MLQRIFLIVIAIMCISSSVLAQRKAKQDTVWLHQHSTQKATLYSAVLPGLGQAYNRHYWKVPIVYAGFATIVYFIDYNSRKYQDYRDGYYNLLNETGDESYKDLPSYPAFPDRYSKQDILENFERNRDYFRRYREISILSFVGFYLINIVEANISAHFLHFDVTEELSMDILPSINPMDPLGNKNAGLMLSFRF